MAAGGGGSRLDARMEFSYDESSPHGPQHWGDLHAEWSTCRDGREQSPVDINNIARDDLPTQRLNVQYHTKPASLQKSGHGVMVKWKDNAGSLVIGKERYMLCQSHWHSPAEHTISGSRCPLEMHTVYKTSAGRTAVIGVMYQRGREDDLFISKLEEPLKQIIKNPEQEISLGDVRPDEVDRTSAYFRYRGSLTTPPCTQGVIWILMEKVKTVSPYQLKLLKEAKHNKDNARPLQPINGRKIELFKQQQGWCWSPKELIRSCFNKPQQRTGV